VVTGESIVKREGKRNMLKALDRGKRPRTRVAKGVARRLSIPY
jgi:hypothetical protein